MRALNASPLRQTRFSQPCRRPESPRQPPRRRQHPNVLGCSNCPRRCRTPRTPWVDWPATPTSEGLVRWVHRARRGTGLPVGQPEHRLPGDGAPPHRRTFAPLRSTAVPAIGTGHDLGQSRLSQRPGVGRSHHGARWQPPPEPDSTDSGCPWTSAEASRTSALPPISGCSATPLSTDGSIPPGLSPQGAA